VFCEDTGHETTTALAARNVGLVGPPFGLGTRLFNYRITPGANDVCIGTGHSELHGNRLDRAGGQESSDHPDSGFGARPGSARGRRQFDRGCRYECADRGIDRYRPRDLGSYIGSDIFLGRSLLAKGWTGSLINLFQAPLSGFSYQTEKANFVASYPALIPLSSADTSMPSTGAFGRNWVNSAQLGSARSGFGLPVMTPGRANG
jgi:hypothetical protein